MSDLPIRPIPDGSSAYESEVIAFGKDAIAEGDAFLRAQKGFNKTSETIDAIAGEGAELRVDKLSSTTSNHIGKIALDLAAGMTDVRPFFEYRTKNPAFDAQVDIYENLGEHWWYNRQIDMRMCDVIKFSCAAGTGYAHQVWDPELLDINLLPEDPRDVLPIRPSSNITLQDALGVIIRRERTVGYVRSQYPDAPDSKIKAEKDGSIIASMRNTRTGRLLEKIGSPFHDLLFGNKAQDQLPRVPTLDLYTMYLKDDRIHKGSRPLPMGEFRDDGSPATNWSYMVEPGDPVYPYKRMIVFTNHGVLYDGPSPYWHGLFPVSKLTLDPWPWSWMGKGVLWDLLPLQRSLDRAVRVWDDWLEKLARPDIIADKNSVSKAALDKIDSRRAGLKIMQNPLAGKGVQIVPPNSMPPDFWRGIDWLINEMNELSGVTNIQALMRLNQMPSSDTIEQIAEKMSPSVRLRSKMIEAFIREFATMLAYNFTQYYTLPMRLTILGAKGVTFEDFDFDPHSLIPDFLGDDFEGGQVKAEAMSRGPRPRHKRAQEVLRQLSFHIAPGSLLAASEITEKLMYLQLARAGILDHWTLLEKLQIPNVGEAPGGTITERLQAEQQMGLGMAVSTVGRKPTAQSMPKQKASGAISESG